MIPCKNTAEEVSFEWSHHRISSTDSKVRTTIEGYLKQYFKIFDGFFWLSMHIADNSSGMIVLSKKETSESVYN